MWKKITLISASLLLLASFSVGLAMCIQYAYLPNVIYQRQNLCEIYECTPFQDTCCRSSGKSSTCNSCTHYYANISLDLNGTIYDKVITSSFCNLNNNTCYYDIRDIYNTLSLKNPQPPISTLGITFLSAGVLITLFLVIAAIYYMISSKIEDSG